jgi:predicted neuraminidase
MKKSLKQRLAVLISFLVAFPVIADIEIEKIFGPETPTGQYKHPSTITELDNGDLYLAYYGGAGEYAEATRVFGSRKAHGSDQWSEPVVIASNPFRSLGNPVLWQSPDGLVWLFYVTRFGETWSTSRVKGKISRDRGQTWSDSFLVTMEPGTMVRSRPILLNNGDYLLPIYHETGADTEFTGADTSTFFVRFDPKSGTWTSTEKIFARMGILQAAVAQVTDCHLIAYCRRGGSYEPIEDGFMVRTESHDGGKTWSPGVDTEFPNPNAAVEFIRLKSGALLLIYNDSMSDRTPLRMALSLDGGKTFPYQKNLVEGPGSFSYPTAIQTRDGKIHVTYTSDDRTTIRHATLEESDLRN